MTLNFTRSVPLYQQISEDIRHQIDAGVLRPNDNIGSHQKLASDYGVSLITIKKALADLINQKYVYSRVGKGTFVAEQPRNIDFSSTITLGLVLRNLKSPFFSRLVESVERESSKLNCNLLVATSSDSRIQETKQIKQYLNLGVAGLILTSTTVHTHVSPMIRQLHSEDFPYVMVSYSDEKDINYIGVDHEYGAYLATKHLIKAGYNKIGYINSEPGYKLGEVRRNGLHRALEEHHVQFNETYHFHLKQRGDWHDYESGFEIGLQFAGLPDRCDALFIYNDLAALGFEKAVIERGLKIPDDVAIIGFDNIKRGVVCPVPLTTVHQPIDEIGKLAIDMIIKKVRGELVNNRIILKPELIIRESCGTKRAALSDLETITPEPDYHLSKN